MKTLKYILHLLLFSVFDAHAADELERIEEGYDHYQKSIQPIEEVMQSWAREYQSITDEEFEKLGSVEKATYQIFEIFWSPLNMDQLFNVAQTHSVYRNVKFLVLQDSIKVQSVDVEDLETITSSAGGFVEDGLGELIEISEFAPRVNRDGAEIFQLTQDRRELFNQFLNIQHYPKEKLNYVNTLVDYQKKAGFLSGLIYIHMGRYSDAYILTQPVVDKIVFNDDLSQANVYFQNFDVGGTAQYTYQFGMWMKKDVSINWKR